MSGEGFGAAVDREGPVRSERFWLWLRSTGPELCLYGAALVAAWAPDWVAPGGFDAMLLIALGAILGRVRKLAAAQAPRTEVRIDQDTPIPMLDDLAADILRHRLLADPPAPRTEPPIHEYLERDPPPPPPPREMTWP